MKNQEIAKIFNNIADILELKGDNPFRIRAYRRAAQNIDGLTEDVAVMKEKTLKKIPGIGQDLAEKITEYTETGKLGFYEELMKEFPSTFLDILSIPGLGPKTAKMLFDRLKISSISDLQKRAIKGALKGLPGIQAKTEENILKGIAMVKRHTERYPIGRVLPIAEDIAKKLRKGSPLKHLDLAGSLRRWKDTIKDIDVLAASKEPMKVMQVFVHLPHVKEVLLKGPTKSSIVTHEGIQVDLRVVEETSFGAALAYFTGSKAHNIKLREMAVKRGLKINEYGVFDVKTERKRGGKYEIDVYKSLKLEYVPPELREDSGEIEAAAHGRLPELIDLQHIKGDLHVHTEDSDGELNFEEAVYKAKQRGYHYLAVTDHSKSLGIARGMSIEQLLDQNTRIKALNKRLKGFALLSGVEMDIKSDGTLDYPNAVLKKLDIVIASIHSGFRQSEEQLTKRLVSAMKNPYVSIIAHPTGRLIGEREAYAVNMEEVLKTARDTGTALEINAYPLRLDLQDIYVRKAKEMGVKLVISTDAHVGHQLDFMRYGVGVARRGWLEKTDVLNSYPCKTFLKKLNQN
jgi:DNA polymerase (family 10)